jgi:integrase
MSRKITGLQHKGGNSWVIDKRVKGIGRIFQRFEADSYEQAELTFFSIITEAQAFAKKKERGQHSFRESATKYLLESTKKSLARDGDSLRLLDPYIGNCSLDNIHQGTLQAFIESRRNAGIKSGTIKRDLAVVRRILTLASRVWRDEQGRPWLTTAPPIIEMPNWGDSAEPYPLSWDEQKGLFRELPDHLAKMALFAVNSGLREQGVCWLRWQWEVKVPELQTSVFVVPGRSQKYSDGQWPGEKNKEDQVVVLNSILQQLIENQRGLHPDYVFPYRGKRICRLHTNGWKAAWRRAGLPQDSSYTKGPHNLKHTFGRRLRAAGVALETRKVLLHHTVGDVTTHYSPAELQELIEAVEKITQPENQKVTLLRRVA